MLGTVIKEKYRIDAKLGQGGMGEVYAAAQLPLGRPVALKVLRLGHGDGVALDRFEREARACSRLNHPNIVQLFDYGVEDDAPYLVMELCQGRSLAEVLRTEGAFPPSRALALLQQLAAAAAEAHRQGIVHRDLKPGNLFLVRASDGGEQLKVLDFGIARWADDTTTRLTSSDGIIGTPAYMAPEQAQGPASPVDGRADLYSMGVVLYEMLAGDLPFRGQAAALLLAHATRSPPPLPASVPAELRRIVGRLLAKRPEDRYPTAAALLLALRAAEGAQAAVPRRRGPPVALAAVLLVAAALCTVGVRLAGRRAASLPIDLPTVQLDDRPPPAEVEAAPPAAAAPATWSLNDVRSAPRPSPGRRTSRPRVAQPTADPLVRLHELRDAYAAGDYAGVVSRFPLVRGLSTGPMWEARDWFRIADSACDRGDARIAKLAFASVSDSAARRRVVRTCQWRGVALQ